jgi:flavin-dependent dehydrogenase
MSSKPTTESYDTAIIGAGLAGLTAGALLARAGKQVIVVEAEDRPGGYLISGSMSPQAERPTLRRTPTSFQMTRLVSAS